MLTQKDIDSIRKIIDGELETVRGQIKLLPTRDEFFTKMDEVVGELKTVREEQAVLSGYKDQLEDHEGRITKLEEVSPT